MKPLLPAIDAAGLLRETAFALLLRDRKPVEVADLARASGLDNATTTSSIASLAQAGWLDIDDDRWARR